MKNEEARKLLGGYATDTLTASEQRALFEAALEDQELFNALQDEQALKQLLADPGSREAIQRELKQSAETRRSPWWSSAWVWGGVAGAAAAAVLIVAMIHQNRPAARSAPVEVASAPKPPDLVREAAPEAKQLEKPPARALNGRSRGPEKLKPLTTGSLAPRAADQIAPSTAPAPPSAISDQPSTQAELREPLGAAPAAGFVAATPTPLQYSLERRGADGQYSALAANAGLIAGDAIRIVALPSVSGSLALEQLDASGGWNRIGQETAVVANMRYPIPDSPIEVRGNAEKFRLVLVPASPPRAKAFARRAESNAAASVTNVVSPFTVDITIEPGRVR